ncbi:MAG: hypothetical protein FJ102_13110 [Deltaproteobacteria bacterium]|nr:hypothetical protein [Deltaproteobacteria bacterium]
MIFLLACTGETTPDSGGSPTIRLLSPTEGAVACGEPLAVVVQVENFVLVPPADTGEEAEPGTGHIDVMLNGQDVAMAWEENIDVYGVVDGAWQLKVELSYADHTPVEPYAGEFVYITVDNEVCE